METDCLTTCETLTHQVIDMEADEAHSIDGSDTESIDSEMSEIQPVPIPPPLPRRHAVEQRRMSIRESEIHYIENYGLVAFCHGSLFTAILQDADYLRAQLTFLGK